MILIQQIFKRLNNKRFITNLCFLLICCYCIPYTLLWENASLTINDSLDSNMVWFKVLLDTGQVWATNNEPVQLFMNGVPRSSFSSEFNFTLLWFWLFGPIGAYNLERWLFALIGFFGMFSLLSKFIIPGNKNHLIQAGVAITFSLYPNWPWAGLSIPGLPFVLYAFLNLRAGDRSRANWIIIAIYSFYSSLVTTGVFFGGLIVVIFISDLFRKRKIQPFFIIGFLLMVVLYVVSHYRLFLNFFVDQPFVSHRVEFGRQGYGLIGFLKYFVDKILRGNEFFLFAVTLAGILMWNYKEFPKKFTFTLLFILITSFLSSFISSKFLENITAFLFQLVPLNLERIAWLYPLLWSILYALSLSYIYHKLVVGKYLVIFLLAGQLAYVFAYHELIVSAFSFKEGEKKGQLMVKVDPSYRHFYAKNQFAEIAKFIGRPKSSYRVLSLGMHPSISQFNGFYTLDGYIANYDRQYKRTFRKILKAEIEKNTVVQEYYDYWGSRAYLFTAGDIGYLNVSGNTIELKNLDFNTQVMKELGGKYIISAVKIDTKTDPEYKFLKKFQDKESAWDIYLYEIL
jgi:hypothetical protein